MKNAFSKFLPFSILIVSLLSIMLVAQSCRDDEEPNWTRYEYVPDFVKDFIYFKTGTQWVYKRIPGGQLDTIDVYSSRLDTSREEEGGNVLYFETMEWKAKSRLDGHKYLFYRAVPTPLFSLIDPTKSMQHHYSISRVRPGLPMGPVRVYHYPYRGDAVNIQIYQKTIDQDTIQGTIYQNIKKFVLAKDGTFVTLETHDGYIESGGSVSYYYAPNVGIVKKHNTTHDISWELVGCTIRQI